MGWSVLQTVSGNLTGSADFSTTTNGTYGSANTAQSLLLAFITWEPGASSFTLQSVTDSVGNFWWIDQVQTTLPDVGHAICHAVANAGTATVTATFSGSVRYREIDLAEVSGDPNGAYILNQHVSQQQTNPGTGTDAVTSTAVNTMYDRALVIGLTNAYNGTKTSVPGTGFTSLIDGTTGVLVSEYQTQTTAGSIAATFTDSTNGATAPYQTLMTVYGIRPRVFLMRGI